MVSFPAVTSIAVSGAAIFAVSTSALVLGLLYRKLSRASFIAITAASVMGLASMIGAYKIYETYLVVTTGKGYEQFDQLCYGRFRQ